MRPLADTVVRGVTAGVEERADAEVETDATETQECLSSTLDELAALAEEVSK